MGEFFAKDYTGAPFELFGVPHLVGLAVILLVNVALIIWGRRLKEGARRYLRYGLAGLMLVVETSWHVWNLATGMWTAQTMLPLHLCSILIWLSIVMLLTKNYGIYEFAYLLGVAGALQALLTPDAGIYGFPHYRFFQVMISHGSLVTAAIYMTVAEGFRPTSKSLVRVALLANAYMVPVALVNMLVGSNYLYIARKPDTASIIDLMPPWPWYLLVIEGIGLAMMLLLYAPFAIGDWLAKRRGAVSQGGAGAADSLAIDV